PLVCVRRRNRAPTNETLRRWSEDQVIASRFVTTSFARMSLVSSLPVEPDRHVGALRPMLRRTRPNPSTESGTSCALSYAPCAHRNDQRVGRSQPTDSGSLLRPRIPCRVGPSVEWCRVHRRERLGIRAGLRVLSPKSRCREFAVRSDL